MSSNNLTFKVQVITPLFSAGADQSRPEIRPPSIRGALRFWFRAMMGGILEGNWKKVRELESEVFGDTDGASKVRIRVKDEKLTVFDPEKNKKYEESNGIVYLAFPYLDRDKKAKKQKWNRSFIEPGSAFLIEVGFFRDEALVPKVIEGTFWLLSHFGGIGGRMRRGFGSLRINPTQKTDGDLEFKPPEKPGDLKKHFKGNLETIEKCFSNYARLREINPSSIFKTDINQIPPFSCFSKWKVVFLEEKKGWTNWRSVMEHSGSFLRAFRNRSDNPRSPTPDYKNVIEPFLDNTSPVKKWDLKNDEFGLPIVYRSQSRSDKYKTNITANLGWKFPNEKDDYDRRSSPLIIRPLYLGDTKYAVVLLLFESEFLPKGAVERLRPDRKWDENKKDKPKPKEIEVPRKLSSLQNFLENAKNNFASLGELP